MWKILFIYLTINNHNYKNANWLVSKLLIYLSIVFFELIPAICCNLFFLKEKRIFTTIGLS
jgi:hypothetical protein